MLQATPVTKPNLKDRFVTIFSIANINTGSHGTKKPINMPVSMSALLPYLAFARVTPHSDSDTQKKTSAPCDCS